MIQTGSKLGGEICESLGLKNVKKITLTCAHDEAAIVEVVMFVDLEDDDMNQIIKKYELKEKTNGKG